MMLSTTFTVSSMFHPRQSNRLPPITDHLLLMPAHKLSKLIKDGSLTSAKLTKAYITRIQLVQPYTNAMTQPRFKEALDDAQKIDDLLSSFRSGKPESEFSPNELELLRSPLLGVPISVKESIMVKDMKNSCGLYERRDAVADMDAVVVRNARRFGMIPICTTNIPEYTMFWADCQNVVYGRSLNPYDPTRIPGASSGGEGSLIGGGASIMGIGTDIGGSLRIPAHYCGIFSHKPSPFLLSCEGNYPALKEYRLRMFTMGPMCRYSSDLRHFLKCLMSDKDNEKQDTYYLYQPNDIGTLRRNVLQRLDEPYDLSQLKLFYFDFNKTSKLKGKQSVRVQDEFIEAQKEILDHFVSKFNCHTEEFNLDEFMRKTMITWQCMLRGGGCPDRDTQFADSELKKMLGIGSVLFEFMKMPLGLSTHTKESLLTVIVDSSIPSDKKKAYELCEKFEKWAAEIKEKFENMLGDNGVFIMPTLPTVAYKHSHSLLKTADLRFPALFNVLQCPVTHATMRLDKKHDLPFGFSIAAKPFNDHLTLSVAEEIEQTFGGWVPPSVATSADLASSVKATSDIPAKPEALANNQQQHVEQHA